MSFKMAGGRARFSGRRAYTPMAEINVTPMVDVMLVLLVVFMITAPLLSVGIPVDLPETGAKTLQGSEEPLTVTVAADARIYLQEDEVDLADLVPRLLAITEARGNKPQIYVRGDRELQYELFVKVMDRITSSGFTKIGLVTASPDKK